MTKEDLLELRNDMNQQHSQLRLDLQAAEQIAQRALSKAETLESAWKKIGTTVLLAVLKESGVI